MVLIDSQDGGLKALRALQIHAPAASCEALKREKPPTRQGQRLYSKRLVTPAKGRPGPKNSRKLESSCAQRNHLGVTRANQRPVTDQFRNRIERFSPCPKTSSSPN